MTTSEPCATCGGTGFVSMRDAEGVDRMRRCPVCFASRMPKGCERYQTATVETLDIDLARRALGAWPSRMLYFYGRAGVGKTWAAIAVARTTGFFEFFWWPDWVVRHRVVEQDNAAVALADLDRATASRNVVVDDIGGEAESDYGRRLLARLLEPRRDDPDTATILTGNYDLDQLRERYDDRIASRIAESAEVVQFAGRDRRVR